jgi:hypothetical protein
VPLRLLFDTRRRGCLSGFFVQQRQRPPAGGERRTAGSDSGGSTVNNTVNVELEIGVGGDGAPDGALRLLYRATAPIAAGSVLVCAPVALLASRHAHRRAAAEPSHVRERISRPETEQLLQPAIRELAMRKDGAGPSGVYAMFVM